jgi:hypothetical protein
MNAEITESNTQALEVAARLPLDEQPQAYASKITFWR